MKPLKRMAVNKGAGAGQFGRGASKTKALNIRPNPMRGGIRL